MELLREYAAAPMDTKPRKMCFRFLESPMAIYGTDRVESIALGTNYLAGTEPFKQWAEATGESTTLPCDLLFRSIGYRGVPMPGVPFDEKKGLIPNVDGRVQEDGGTLPGLYVAGWIKRGPTGIIGTNKPDSHNTADRILEDLSALPHCPVREPAAIPALLDGRGVRYVTMADWQKIDAAEQARGVAIGKPRERFTRIEEMLAVLD
jgi:ferredoxin--NADP+ reductase